MYKRQGLKVESPEVMTLREHKTLELVTLLRKLAVRTVRAACLVLLTTYHIGIQLRRFYRIILNKSYRALSAIVLLTESVSQVGSDYFSDTLPFVFSEY